MEEGLRKVAVLMLLLLALGAWGIPALVVGSYGGRRYFAKIDYVIAANTTVSLLFTGDEVKEIAAPPHPPGYELHYLEVRFPQGLPQGLIPLKFDGKVEIDGVVKALISREGIVKIASTEANVTLDAYMVAYYVKREWLELTEGEVRFEVKEPTPPFTKDDMIVRISIDNHAPYAILDVAGPDGASLLEGEIAPDAVRVDPKHVEVNFKYFEPGVYTIKVGASDDYTLPSSFILIEGAFANDTLRPGETKRYAVARKLGWRTLGAVVVLYTVAPLTGKASGGASVVGELVDYAYAKDETVRIRAASLLIPDLNLRVWVKAYIVFGTWFEVSNQMKSVLNVMYTPVLVKEAGTWTPSGVEVTVKESDVRDASLAYVVVQAPNYGKVAGILTPSGDELGTFSEGVLPWGDEYRSIRVFDNEAYVQVKAFGVMEVGRYTIRIEWEPVSFRLVDADGKPVVGARVRVSGPLNLTAISDERGIASFELYKPGAYDVTVKFKGVTVATVSIGSIVKPDFEVKCKVYEVAWLLTNAWDKPLKGAELVIRGPEGLIAKGVSDDEGMVRLGQLPGGQFTVEASYKRVSRSDVVEISGSGVRRMKLDVFLELPVIGVPLTMLETLVAVSTTGVSALGLTLARRRGVSNVEEEELSLEE
ncbi:MAG TPA: carboxypeptidase regulatory-like domain-containing protein [Thermofilaceae archaeon]|nr:carboxypeptidase regulatory-like domain-containing protein [Thermofilaceae archaeon]